MWCKIPTGDDRTFKGSKISILILMFLTISLKAFSQSLVMAEAEYLVTLTFEKANRLLIAKEFEYTSASTYPNSKWLNYRRLDNDRDYQVSIQVENIQSNIVACSLLTTNFYEANIFKAEIEKRYNIVASKLDGQSLTTDYEGKSNSKNKASFTISVDPEGTGKKAYFIRIRDDE